MPETYGPTLLKWKASQLRKITGEERYRSESEITEVGFLDRIVHNMYRPVVLFATEPIIILFTLWLTINNIVLYTFLTGFGFIFTDIFNLSQGLTFLGFLALGVGFTGISLLVPREYQRYKKALAQAHEKGLPTIQPEQRLSLSMLGAPFLPIGLFWMGWTAYPSINVWVCLAAAVPIGFSMLATYISATQYLIDAFESHAATALVMVTFVRYSVAGGMVEVSIPMYKNIGVHWTLTVLGAISLLITLVPFVFFKYGEAIRKRSRQSVDH